KLRLPKLLLFLRAWGILRLPGHPISLTHRTKLRLPKLLLFLLHRTLRKGRQGTSTGFPAIFQN
ncbi:MAG: hypothetical protein LIP16_13485, partial [Clostridium sp.]|nr:hypothetical protein [Clostridium sp.]